MSGKLRKIVAALLLLLLLPIIVAALVAVGMEVGLRKAIFLQTRVGKNGTPFTINKIRTMWEQKSPTESKKVTRTGSILRMLRVDELPQLLNVIRGEMGFVGPRPFRVELHEDLLGSLGGFEGRYSILPGVTGLAQVLDPDSQDRDFSLRCDLHYIRSKSVGMDVWILALTIMLVASSAVGWDYYRLAGHRLSQLRHDVLLNPHEE